METNFFVVRIYGGLGNQLFQYALSLYLEKIYNIPVYLETSFYKNSHREFLLPKLFMVKVYDGDYTKLPIYKEKIEFMYDKELEKLDVTINYCFDGYWQSKIIVQSIVDDIKIEKISNSNFGIHIRRTDYLNNPDIFIDLTNTGYYRKALSYAGNRKVVIFSDDIEWCKKYGNNQDFRYSNGDTISDFKEMINCAGLVIANSTYSLWAAYFNNGEIYAPSLWQCNESYIKDSICLDNWRII